MSEKPSSAVPPLVIRQSFNAPIARVFAAFTEAELVRVWMCPPRFTVTEAVVEPNEGGKYRIVMRYPEGDIYEWSHANESGHIATFGVFTEVRDLEKLAYTMRHEGDAADESVTVEFRDRGTETDVMFMHRGFANERSRRGGPAFSDSKSAFAK